MSYRSLSVFSKILIGLTITLLFFVFIVFTLFYFKANSIVFNASMKNESIDSNQDIDNSLPLLSASASQEIFDNDRQSIDEIKKIPQSLKNPAKADSTENLTDPTFYTKSIPEVHISDKEETPITEKTSTTQESTDGYKYIALTFDDGPYDAVDEKILDILSQYEGRATFFVLGDRVVNFPQTIKKMVEQGSEIGNHSFSHPNLTELSYQQINNEINNTNQAVKDISGYDIEIYRPTFGEFNQDILDSIAMPAIMWNVDTMDWSTKNSAAISEQLYNVDPGSIVLMHSLYPETAAALEEAIPRLYQEGYRFVTVSELFDKYDIELQDHAVYGNAYSD